MKLKITLILSLVFIAVILKIITFSKNFVENFYSRTIYKTIAGSLNKLSSNVSFSIGEVLLFVFIITVILFIILAFKHSFFNHNIASIKEKLKMALNFIYVFICFIVIVYIVFMLVWGLNYYRVPLIEYYANNSSITDDDIYNLADRLIRNVNDLKDEMKYTDINTNYQVLNRIVESEYNKVFEYFEFLNMHYSKTKPIKISKLFLHLQITGIYSPFTSEANVNILIPSVSIPFTIAHEMAHQIGIAYEDEANFISYAACSKNTDVFVRYSANFEALLYVLGEIKRDENYSHLMSNLNSETKDEIKKYYEFWQGYSGQLSKVSEKVNDTYLKANNQQYGVKSYSRVVRLLVLYYKNNSHL
ncbi:DUF3810 domain-containing protein [Brachyspira murdochii]|uniref:DUF3810 domain-containing protein n=1 Tax=Brachyspira murdochii (strain ATCC 51284 / DSM 12563 / 56-150) TaxID=526224 RepID=D5U8I7_BRAM5|nr:DUF3810 domain-containing protein [Brachyspira murdochii]ADG71010.1 conserved hypothetical protein [Brachyspira murdochii DSM 12563]